MQDEQFEILAFLRRLAPFAALDDATLRQVAQAVDVRYCRAGTRIVEFGQDAQWWHLVRSGVVEVFRRDGTLYNRLTEGGYFGEFGLLHRKKVRFPAAALEDTLLYLVPEAVFSQLFEQHEAFADQVKIEDRTRLRQAVSRQQGGSALLSAPVGSLLRRAPVSLPATATALQAAQRMTEAGVSSLLVTGDAQPRAETGAMLGILTDRDLRSRLLAAGLPHSTPLAQLMTPAPVTVQAQQLLHEAMLQMLRHNVHHLPVLQAGHPVGLLALADVVRYESHHSVFLVGSIFKAADVDALAALGGEVRSSFLRLISDDSSPRVVGAAMAAIGRAFKQRLLELAEAQFGPPPVPYSFLALGSMARQEQLIVTDQDNALMLDDRFDAARHEAYFLQLADFVCQGLARCGYPLCSGGVMANQPAWRLTRRAWQQRFTQWMAQPTPEGLLDSGIAFDLDQVNGPADWAQQLRDQVARQAHQHPRFLASMARNALLRTPPLGFFKNFVLEADGRHSAAINLKRRGTAPLVDLVRVHALAVGSTALNTLERLDDVMQAGVLPPGRGPDLHDALVFIQTVRMRRQAQDLQAGREPDNSIEPEQLSEFERKSLRDAFTVLSHAQDHLRFKHQSAHG